MNGFKLFKDKSLLNVIESCNKYKPRFIVNDIISLISNKNDFKVIELFGNRRTGKTIAMFHTIKKLLEDNNLDSVIYILCNSSGNIKTLCDIIDSVNDKVKYIFIDEITLLDDFISSINFITDSYPNKTIVLTGSASLSFVFAESMMFGRYHKIDSTFISYSEWVYLKGENESILDYIHNCGILDNSLSVSMYINDFINENIEKSLDTYRNQSNFINPYSSDISYLAEEYPGIITKITEDFTTRFLISNLKNKFSFFKLSNKYLNDKSFKDFILNKINSKVGLDTVTKNGLDFLEDLLIKGNFYYKILDVVSDFDSTEGMYNNKINYHLAQMQPCIRYNQSVQFLDELISRNLLSTEFNKEHYLELIEGKILEDIVRVHVGLYFDKRDGSKKIKSIKTFKLNNTKEIDLIVQSSFSYDAYLIEIKRSKDYRDSYSKWILDDEVNSLFNVTKSIVLYRGKTTFKIYDNKRVDIINVEDFLKNLDKYLNDKNDEFIKARVF